MPEFLMFAPCDNVLLSEGNVSLITVMSELTLSPLEADAIPDPIPEGAAMPLRWFIFTQWGLGPQDTGIRYEQRVALMTPDLGRTLIDSVSEFTPEAGKLVQRLIARLNHFPLGPGGDYRLKLFLRNPAIDQEWRQMCDYPFRVSYRAAPVGGL